MRASLPFDFESLAGVIVTWPAQREESRGPGSRPESRPASRRPSGSQRRTRSDSTTAGRTALSSSWVTFRLGLLAEFPSQDHPAWAPARMIPLGPGLFPRAASGVADFEDCSGPNEIPCRAQLALHWCLAPTGVAHPRPRGRWAFEPTEVYLLRRQPDDSMGC
jgi:hypothetical protein